MTLSGVSQVCCRVLVALTLASSLSAGVIFERALPTANLNDTAGANRSNVSWAPGDSSYILGDDFTLASDSVINSLSVWEVSNNGAPTTEFGSISLYAGADPNLSLISSIYSSSLVSGYQYQGSSGAFYDVYKITFSGLNWSVPGGVLYDFGIGATAGTESSLFLHGSNAALSGSTQNGADGVFLGFDGPPYSYTFAIDSAAGEVPLWDKSSDINVEIDGSAVPEPATFGLLAIGAGAFLVLRRRRA
jgi:hypothetical protein